MNNANRPWNLESFLDSLIMELDKARDTLALKAINKPLTYSVKDMSLELQIFPEYDGDQVKFTTAKPGESGASKVSIQLGSVTDRQIRQSTKEPVKKGEISIEEVKELDDKTKSTLKRIGVSSINDLEKMEKSNIDLSSSIAEKGINYNKLAGIIKKTRQGSLSPQIRRVSLSKSNGRSRVLLEGENLYVDSETQPEAMINKRKMNVISASENKLVLELSEALKLEENNELLVYLDPQRIMKMNLKK